jgi:hypothetical protein
VARNIVWIVRPPARFFEALFQPGRVVRCGASAVINQQAATILFYCRRREGMKPD